MIEKYLWFIFYDNDDIIMITNRVKSEWVSLK